MTLTDYMEVMIMKINFEVETQEMIKFFEFLNAYADFEKARNDATVESEKARRDAETKSEFLMTALREGLKKS